MPKNPLPPSPRRASPPSAGNLNSPAVLFCVFSPPRTQVRAQSASEPATHASTRVSAANRRQNHKNFALRSKNLFVSEMAPRMLQSTRRTRVLRRLLRSQLAGKAAERAGFEEAKLNGSKT
ncbi:hypothetical protein BD311DRAFT_69348 [Dichomitus squalens]|uniref:Uncharacterized protein n=1 Tax=Dichomitus squalens TaxID=114155 RepID=A0A4Q9M973_9APHY|nr:hypothetical protein BD311DRAFT_69348 [Dichomitus squalens]